MFCLPSKKDVAISPWVSTGKDLINGAFLEGYHSPSFHPFLDGIVPYKPSFFGVPPFVETPMWVLVVEKNRRVVE